MDLEIWGGSWVNLGWIFQSLAMRLFVEWLVHWLKGAVFDPGGYWDQSRWLRLAGWTDIQLQISHGVPFYLAAAGCVIGRQAVQQKGKPPVASSPTTTLRAADGWAVPLTLTPEDLSFLVS